MHARSIYRSTLVSSATFASRGLDEESAEQGYWCQGLDFRKPLHSSSKIEQARQLIRQHSPFYDHDRYFAPDINAAMKLIQSGAFNSLSAIRPER